MNFGEAFHHITMAALLGLQAWTLLSVNRLQIDLAIVQTKLVMIESRAVNQAKGNPHELAYKAVY